MRVGSEVDEQFWAGFPLDQSPRALILLDQFVQNGQHGFGRDGEAKRAWDAGAIEARIDLPAGLLERLAPSGRSQHQGQPIEILAVERVEASFRTDRGPRDLPAYRVTTTGLVEPCIVLDPAVHCWWPAPDARDRFWRRAGDATIADDDRTIDFMARGGALTLFHGARFVEHPTFVVAHAITTKEYVPPGTAVPLYIMLKTVTGVLRDPLGARVLLTPGGTPLGVAPITSIGN